MLKARFSEGPPDPAIERELAALDGEERRSSHARRGVWRGLFDPADDAGVDVDGAKKRLGDVDEAGEKPGKGDEAGDAGVTAGSSAGCSNGSGSCRTC